MIETVEEVDGELMGGGSVQDGVGGVELEGVTGDTADHFGVDSVGGFQGGCHDDTMGEVIRVVEPSCVHVGIHEVQQVVDGGVHGMFGEYVAVGAGGVDT